MSIVANHVPFTDTREWLLSDGIQIAVVVALAVVVLVSARFAVRRMRRRLEGAESLTMELDLQRSATLTQAVSNVVRIMVFTIAILLVLGQFGINLGPLLAGAGIAGVALGFGAQSLVKDFLSGFFILLENQFGVSDIITADVGSQRISGKVETISLRSTQIRSFDGTLHTVPNGNIVVVGNTSRGWARAIVDVGVAYGEDVHRVRGVLEELFEEIRQDENLREAFFSGPEVLGVERFGDYDVVLRVVAQVRPTRKWALERDLRARIKERFDQRGIEIPIPAIPRPDGGQPQPS